MATDASILAHWPNCKTLGRRPPRRHRRRQPKRGLAGNPPTRYGARITLTNPTGTTNRLRAARAGFGPLAGDAGRSSATGRKIAKAGDDRLTMKGKVCRLPYMAKQKKTYRTLTEALRDAINESDLSFKALERDTGVIRQSLMPFARGEQTIMLESADKLAKFFGLEIVKRKAK